MVAMLIKPLPTYLDMPVLQLDNVALSGETLATIAEAETAIALIRTARIDATDMEWRLLNSCHSYNTRHTLSRCAGSTA